MVQWVLSVFNGNNVKGAEKLKKKSSFSGQIGFVLAAAGSAVGVGNLWRFPYLVARDGGGLFLIIYLVLVLTFGFTLLTTDISIGRKTGQSAIRAYESMRPGWKKLGFLTFMVPVLIMTADIILPWYMRTIILSRQRRILILQALLRIPLRYGLG